MSVSFDPKYIKFSKSTSTPDFPQKSNCVGYWTFNETTGDYTDSSGNSNTGLPTGIVHNSSGKMDYCVEYDTDSDYVRVANSETFHAVGPGYTVAFWFKIDQLPSTAARIFYILRQINSTYGKSIQVSIPNDDDHLAVEVYDIDGVAYAASTNYSWSLGTWYHVVVVIQSGTPIYIYVNGSESSTTHTPANYGSMAIVHPDSSSYIGAMSAASTSAIDGCIDEMGWWYNYLSSSEVSDLYNGGAGNTYH